MGREILQRICGNIQSVIVGKEAVVELALTALLAKGHILVDDVPGMGKTKLANSLARSLGVTFKRIQFTPDLQPADITGIYYYNQKQGDFLFRPGPVFTNILLADEINRAVPRTQASLLEAMEEQQVSIEGELFALGKPFMVIATQNPVELEGTFPLPEAQLDRFLLKIEMGYPTKEQEVTILKRFQKEDPLEKLRPVASEQEVLELCENVKQVRISDDLVDYVARLARASRDHEKVLLGVSPRGSLALLKASMAFAYIKGRDYVLPDDIKFLFPYVAKHRILLKYEGELHGETKDGIVEGILRVVSPPVEQPNYG